MKEWNWQLHPEGWNILNNLVDRFIDEVPDIKKLKQEMIEITSTRLIDWIDHLLVPESWIDQEELKGAGFKSEKVNIGTFDLVKYTNDNSAMFPLFTIDRDLGRLYVNVENIEDFASKWDALDKIEGKKWGSRRKVMVADKDGLFLGAIERRGYYGYLLPDGDEEKYHSTLTRFMERDRWKEEEIAFRELEDIIEYGVNTIGKDRTADAFFFAERRYWESQNQAGRIQLKRQNELGLGWGNRDHHTFRCSRKNFSRVISILESIGMEPRERFYAGEQAGWGAQVMEQKVCNIAVFADVDLTPDEKDGDFAHKGLKELDHLGTVGLWVGLHGESILSAGLHHIAALVDYDKMMGDSPSHNIENMAPFSSFPYLKQCFSKGEYWNIVNGKADDLHDSKLITDIQHEKFSSIGGLGSHLEFIERNDGFKGFNQTAVSDIISRTDPRN